MNLPEANRVGIRDERKNRTDAGGTLFLRRHGYVLLERIFGPAECGRLIDLADRMDADDRLRVQARRLSEDAGAYGALTLRVVSSASAGDGNASGPVSDHAGRGRGRRAPGGASVPYQLSGCAGIRYGSP